jgi:hypothetical protein
MEIVFIILFHYSIATIGAIAILSGDIRIRYSLLIAFTFGFMLNMGFGGLTYRTLFFVLVVFMFGLLAVYFKLTKDI